jgi:hypothetical protein
MASCLNCKITLRLQSIVGRSQNRKSVGSHIEDVTTKRKQITETAAKPQWVGGNSSITNWNHLPTAVHIVWTKREKRTEQLCHRESYCNVNNS